MCFVHFSKASWNKKICVLNQGIIINFTEFTKILYAQNITYVYVSEVTVWLLLKWLFEQLFVSSTWEVFFFLNLVTRVWQKKKVSLSPHLSGFGEIK